MLGRFSLVVTLVVMCCPAYAVEQSHGILVGEILKLDAAAKTVLVKTADGTKQTFHFAERTAVHGSKAAAVGAKDTFQGLKEGSQVAVRYTSKGTEKTAQEIDSIGKDGLKATQATVVRVDQGTKTLVVKTADGTNETYRMTDNAAKDAGKEIGKGAEKSVKVTVYSTEEAGQKVAHFFKRVI